jgi:hypothetical protein
VVLFPRNPRLEAALCWIAAAELLALILQLSGPIPFVGVLDTVLSVAAPCLLLAVFAVLFSQLRPSQWSFIALLFSIVNVVMVLVGDAMQHVVFHATDASIDKGSLWVATFAIRDVIGNNFLYLALAIFGFLLLAENRRWLAGLALLNAALGWLDLAFAAQLGLPPHTNFLLIVVWLIVLGTSSWRDRARAAARSGVTGPAYTSAVAA